SANDNAVFIPWSTMLVRYFDRSRQKVETADDENGEDSEKEVSKEILLNQLDKIYMQVEASEYLKSSASLARRILLRRHNQQEDFNIIIPELILEQEERTRDVFNLVLVAIAAISLIVGGIGIMNIMLASVMERTKEIGIRLALGAKKKDVMMQFLGEAVFISISGGIIGILLGVGLSKLISNISIILPDQAGINTIISLGSVLVSFLVATGVGIIFGYAPARKAALQDPVVSLRYE
ncbi:MAG: FtsX-like permease family protein, partial [Bacteroidales bacterium]|nr:FtsX-like permease family protein [Bacteroidales bacterium]